MALSEPRVASCPDLPSQAPPSPSPSSALPSGASSPDAAGLAAEVEARDAGAAAALLSEAVAAEQLQRWRQDPDWTEEPAVVEASNPNGTFLRLDSSALVALPPAEVFSLLCDTGNKRVFKNVKGVRNRTVLEETPSRTVLELEMVTGWRFFIFSGEFGVFLRLTQDRETLKLSFELANPGFMRQFSGEWSVQPVEVPGSVPGTPDRVASRVGLVQHAQPALGPPPILAQYLRQIAAKTLRESMEDMQLEAARIRHNLPEDVDVRAELKQIEQGNGRALKTVQEPVSVVA